MAGMGPPPNPNARRQNNRDAGMVKLDTPRAGKVPSLPGDDWSEATRRAWVAWWKSPQATQWDEVSDFPSVVLMARQYDLAMTGDGKAAGEFRQWADRFGLAPLARLRNRWIVGPEAEGAAGAAEATVVKLRSAG